MSSAGALGSLRSVWSNEAVRRAQLALAGSTIGDWSYGVAISVLVYERSGAAWVGIAQVCRLVPAAIAAPLLASLIDRFPKQRVLLATDASRALLMTGIFLCAAVDAPLLMLLALATVNTVVSTLFWPAQGAMLPTLVRDPEELTVANVASTTVESTGCVIGPALGAAALAAFGTTFAFAVPIVAYMLSAAAITRVRPRVSESALPSDDEGEPVADPNRHGMLAGLTAIVRNGNLRVLVGLYCAQVLVAGALNVLTVVVALQLLDAGNSGVGALLAASGIGGLLGAVPAFALAKRVRLTTTFSIGLLLWGLPIAAIGLVPNLPLALVMLGLVGVGNTLVDVSAITLLQRATPSELHGRVFGVLESVVIASVALGAAATPVLLRVIGDRAALVITGALLPLVTLPLWQRLRRLDAPTVDPRRIELMLGDPIFAPLPRAIIEQLAGSLEPVSLEPRQVLFEEGGEGGPLLPDRRGDGARLTRHPGGRPARARSRIRRDRADPRHAAHSHRNGGDARACWHCAGDEFLAAVTGHTTSAEAADAVISSRLLSLRPSLASV